MIEYTVKVGKYATRWFLNDKRHREDGPAVEWVDGTKVWYCKGKLHREGGPAIEYADGAKYWYRNGELHCEDGPAIELADGSKEWYLENVEYTEEKFNLKMNPVKELTVQEISKLLGYDIKIVK